MSTRNPVRLFSLVATVTLALAALGLGGWRWGVIAKLQSLASVKEAKAGPRETAVPTIVRADGRVSTYPNASVVVGTETGGTLTTFRVAEKQSVKRGDVIAELDASEQRAALVEAHARVREADVAIAFLSTQVVKSQRLLDAGAVPRDDLDRTKHQFDMASAQRAVAAATAQRLAATEAKTKIRAPFDGVVLERHAEERETLAPGARLVTIADLSKLRIDAEVDEFDAGRVALGATVTITAEGHTGSWKGTVEEVPSMITKRRTKPDDPTRPTDTRVLLVKIAITDASSQGDLREPVSRGPRDLRLGQRVEVAIGR